MTHIKWTEIRSSNMNRVISLISRLRAILTTTSTFQRVKAAEFLVCMKIIVSKLTGSNGDNSEVIKLKDILVLGESISNEGGVTKEKAIKAFDIVLSQMTDVLNSSKLLSETAISGELDSMEQRMEIFEGKNPQQITSPPTSTISLDDLDQERHFLTGYKAIKNGKLVYVALFDGLPSWYGTHMVKNTSLDKMACLEFVMIRHECKSLLPSLAAGRYAEIECRRLQLLREADLRCRLMTAVTVIARHVHNLAQVHSNLVAVEPCWIDGAVMIRFLVSCKHYVPEDEDELPDQLDGFRTCVKQGWFRSTGFYGGLEHQSCLKPGCALSAEPISGRNCGDSTFGTVGGYVTIHGTPYAVTVGHLFRTSGSVSNT